MKKISLAILGLVFLGALSVLFPGAPAPVKIGVIQAVPFTDVKITDEFWNPRIEVNRKVTIPYLYKKFGEGGRTESKTM